MSHTSFTGVPVYPDPTGTHTTEGKLPQSEAGTQGATDESGGGCRGEGRGGGGREGGGRNDETQIQIEFYSDLHSYHSCLKFETNKKLEKSAKQKILYSIISNIKLHKSTWNGCKRYRI